MRKKIHVSVSSFIFTSKSVNAQKMKFSIKDFFSKCDKIHSFLRIWSHSLKKFLMENFIFCAVCVSSVKIYLSKRSWRSEETEVKYFQNLCTNF